MHVKQYLRLLFILSALIAFLLFSLNYIVDPFDKNGYNPLHIKHKLLRNDHLQKLTLAKKFSSIDNLILGSSRAQRMDAQILSNRFGGTSFNFSVASAGLEDHLGIILWLEKMKKMPKNLILTLDFSYFNDHVPLTHEFLQAKALNFLKATQEEKNSFYSYFSLQTTRASVKTLKAFIKGTLPNHSFRADGTMVDTHPFDRKNFYQKMSREVKKYLIYNYSKGNYLFSQKRFGYFKRILSIAKKHHTRVYIMLTPVYSELYKHIDQSVTLSKALNEVKKRLKQLPNFYDAMLKTKETADPLNFQDAVHTSTAYGNQLLKRLLQKFAPQ